MGPHEHRRLLHQSCAKTCATSTAASSRTPPRSRSTDDQFELLIEASRADWRDVEPAIFGTLLERALDPVERHKLGAHYTPRAYVERLVMPTVIEPLRAEWDAVQAAAVTLASQGDTKKAAAEVQRFHRRLCEVRVLDPACGSGNFLYVTLEHLKRLEGEVLDALDRLGDEQAALEMAGDTVDPHQLLGLEVNPRAAAIAELVLWIGYLQWHFRTRGSVRPAEPIIRNFHNIECRDAVLAYDRTEPVLDEHGKPVTRWDGRTMKPHPVTGEEVPDETARVPRLALRQPAPRRVAAGGFHRRQSAVHRRRSGCATRWATATSRRCVPRTPTCRSPPTSSCIWWNHAAALVRAGKSSASASSPPTACARPSTAGCSMNISAPTNSSCVCIPDHPWVDSADGAAVRICHDGRGKWAEATVCSPSSLKNTKRRIQPR